MFRNTLPKNKLLNNVAPEPCWNNVEGPSDLPRMGPTLYILPKWFEPPNPPTLKNNISSRTSTKGAARVSFAGPNVGSPQQMGRKQNPPPSNTLRVVHWWGPKTITKNAYVWTTLLSLILSKVAGVIPHWWWWNVRALLCSQSRNLREPARSHQKSIQNGWDCNKSRAISNSYWYKLEDFVCLLNIGSKSQSSRNSLYSWA